MEQIKLVRFCGGVWKASRNSLGWRVYHSDVWENWPIAVKEGFLREVHLGPQTYNDSDFYLTGKAQALADLQS